MPARPAPDAAYLSAASRLADLEIAPEWQPGTLRFLAFAAEMAEVLERVPLDDADLVQAPVFRLPGPDA